MIEARQKSPATNPYLDATHSLLDIVNHPVFENEKKSGVSRERSLTNTAAKLARLEGPAINPTAQVEMQQQRDAYYLLAEMNEITHASEGMRHSREISKLPPAEFKAHKARAVKFNHALREMFDNDPTLNTDEAAGFAKDMYAVLNRGRWNDEEAWQNERKWFNDQIDCTIRGMQHEIFAEQIIDSLKNYEPDNNVSVEDDLNGVDIFVINKKTGVKFPIDVKASSFTARKAKQKSRNPKHIIWSGIDSKKTNSRVRLTTEEIQATKNYMHNALRQAENEYIIRHPIVENA